jgi:integrase/recombinase XerC
VKNKKTKVQPLPADLAELLRGFLAGKPVRRPVWAGTGAWAKDRKGAEMLRLDLEAAGIPYAVDGPSGPQYADFHSLRHTYLTAGGRASIDLRTLQELAGHGTSKLTERDTHVRLHDLAGAVEKLPSFLPPAQPAPEAQTLRATGTEGEKLVGPRDISRHPGAFVDMAEGKYSCETKRRKC